MDEIPADEIQQALWSFTQTCFKGKIGKLEKVKLYRDLEDDVFIRFRQCLPLTARELSSWSLKKQKLVLDLLSRFISLIQTIESNPETSGLMFPYDFLDDSDPNQLGASLLAYIAERSSLPPNTH